VAFHGDGIPVSAWALIFVLEYDGKPVYLLPPWT